MATEPVATILSRRCASCGALYPYEEEHRCPVEATAATVEVPAPSAVAAATQQTVRPTTPELAATQPMPTPATALAGTVPLALPTPEALPTVESPRLGLPTGPSSGPPAKAAALRPGAPTPLMELVGLVLGERYEITQRLSAGGMGVVYKGRHIVLESPVAVKVLLRPQDSTAQRRFLQEAKVASAIRHPNTVYISDFGVLLDGRSYLVMEFLQGPTLAKVLSGGRLDPVRACRIALQIAQGLQAVHARGIVHRGLWV